MMLFYDASKQTVKESCEEPMSKIKCLLMTQVLKHLVREKTDPYVWIFSSVDNCYYNYNSRYLFEYVKDHLTEVTPYFVINDPERRRKLSEKYGEKYFIEAESAAGIRKVLGAGVWFTSAGLPVYGTRLKKNRLIINLWHGVPLKKIALLDPNLGKKARIYFSKLFSENYSCILTTSRTLVPIMAQSFDVPEKIVKVWGQPRNDGLFGKLDRNAWIDRIYGELPEYNKTVLYAPTFRDYGRVQLFPFEDFDNGKLKEFLEEHKILLFIRTHIEEKECANIYLSDRVRYLGNHEAEDVTGFMNAFDCLITDYSSIYVDYLLTDRPIVFLPYDKDVYLDERGMNFDYDDVTPGPKPETMEEFLKCLEQCLENEDPWKKERHRVNALLNEVREPCSGHICRQVLKTIKKREKEQ